jgi:di/tricarboxylate transporter
MLIPCNELFTFQVKTFLAVTVLGILVLAFELCHGMFVGMYFPVVYTLLNLAPKATIFAGWTTTTIYVCLGALTLAVVLEQCGLLRRISLFCLYKVGGTYSGIMVGVLLAGVATSFMTSCTAYAVMAAFVYGISVTMKLKPSLQTAGLVVVGCMSTLTIEQIIYYPAGLAILYTGGRTVIPDLAVGYVEQIFYNWPIILFFVLFTMLLIKIIPKPEINGKEAFTEQYRELGPMTGKEKKAALLAGCMLVYLLTTSLTGLPIDYAFLVVPWLFFLPGIDLANADTVQKINFTMIFLTAGFMSIGNTGAALGIANIASTVMQPLLAPFGAHASLSILLLAATVMNLALTPFAIYTAFAAPVAQICVDMGINPMAGLYTLLFAGDCVFLPYENLSYLLFFSFGMVRMKDFIKLCSLKVLCQIIWYIVIVYPWWSLCGFMYHVV